MKGPSCIVSHAYKIHKQDAAYFMTIQVVKWVDIFTRKRYKEIVVDAMNYAIQNKGLIVYSYVIMSNHVHLVASADYKNLSEVTGRLKSHTSKKLIESICNETESRREWMLDLFTEARLTHKRNSNYQIRTHENHAEECYSPAFTTSKIKYIHDNPVKAGIVESPEEYMHSSAVNYSGRKGMVPVVILHPHLAFR